MVTITDPKEVDRILKKKSFKVVIFGSARLKPGNFAYDEVFNLAEMIGARGMDLVTGGGPGLMEAAGLGHHKGRTSKKAKSIGLAIHIPHERIRKAGIDVETNFTNFSDRLEEFELLANAIVIAPGGVGTMLEFFYTWQLLQTRKIKHIPVIMLGEIWVEFMRWIKNHPVKHGFIDDEETELIHVTKNYKEAMEIIEGEYKKYKKANK